MKVSHCFKLPYDLSASTILTFAYYHDPFKSLACIDLGYEGTVESVSGESCIGVEGKSLFQIVDMTND